MRTKLDQWLELPGEERWLLAGLVVLLPAIGIALCLFGVRRTYRLLGGSGRPAPLSAESSEDSSTSAKRLGRLVSIASRRGPYMATCLPQSIALRWLLCRRGMPAEVRIGVRKEHERIHAHAWVELAGQVINDHSAVEAEYAVYREFATRLVRH